MILKRFFFFTLFLVIGTLAEAQPLSILQFKSDTTFSVNKDLAEILSRPFYPLYDSLTHQLTTLMAYDADNKIQRISFSTPINEKITEYNHKAQSEWLLGVYKAALLEHYIKMGSGVLPLIEKTIAHFDSSAAYYSKVNQYIIGNTLIANQVDSSLTAVFGLSLKERLKRMEKEQSFDALEGFSFMKGFRESFNKLEMTGEKDSLSQSLTYWIWKGINDFQPQPKSGMTKPDKMKK